MKTTDRYKIKRTPEKQAKPIKGTPPGVKIKRRRDEEERILSKPGEANLATRGHETAQSYHPLHHES